MNATTKRRVRVTIKEVQKSTIACLACRLRRSKCDGNPCSLCVSQSQHCEFPEAQKRGPKHRNIKQDGEHLDVPGNSDLLPLVTASMESKMLDQIEANKFFQFFQKNMACAGLGIPLTVAKKVHIYASLAMSARVLGDRVASQKYITQARVLGGLIYDCAEQDAALAMFAMFKYHQLIFDIPRATHYANLGLGISKMAEHPLDETLSFMCKVTTIVINDENTKQQHAKLLKELAKGCGTSPPLQCAARFMEFAALFLDVIGFYVINASFPKTLESLFYILDNAKISPEDRIHILDSLNIVMLTPCDVPHYTMFNTVFIPMYMAITEWKSGHIPEAVQHTLATLSALHYLQDNETLGLLSDLPDVCVIGSLAKFLHEQHHDDLAMQMCNFVYRICDVMSPDLDFIRPIINHFVLTNLQHPSPPSSSPSTSLQTHHFQTISNTDVSITSSPLPTDTPLSSYLEIDNDLIDQISLPIPPIPITVLESDDSFSLWKFNSNGEPIQ